MSCYARHPAGADGCPRIWSRRQARLAEEGVGSALAGALRERWAQRPGG